MIIIRIITCLLVAIFSIYLTSDYYIYFTPEQKDIIVVDGIINIWASISGIFIGLLFLMYYVSLILKHEIAKNKLNLTAIILIFIAAPLLSIFVKSTSITKTNTYIECKELREISSRYSSRTYAKSKEYCEKIL